MSPSGDTEGDHEATSTDLGGNLASSTGADTATAAGHDIEVNKRKAKKAWLMKSSTRFLQQALECQVAKHMRTIPIQELVLVDEPSEKKAVTFVGGESCVEAFSDLNRRCVGLYTVISTYTELLSHEEPFGGTPTVPSQVQTLFSRSLSSFCPCLCLSVCLCVCLPVPPSRHAWEFLFTEKDTFCKFSAF